MEDFTWPRKQGIDISNKVHKHTWLPVSTERLVITLPQHEEIYHIWHVVIPAGEINVTSMGK